MCLQTPHLSTKIDQFLSKSNYILPWVSSLYILFIIGSGIFPSSHEKVWWSLHRIELSGGSLAFSPHWSLTNVLIVQAPRRGCSPASIPYLGSQCLWWLEATVPSTQVCHLPSPSAHDLATLLWDWVLYLGDCKEVGSLPLESPWDSQSPNLPSVLQFRDGLLSLEGTRELERAASVPTPPNIKLISLQWGPFPF